MRAIPSKVNEELLLSELTRPLLHSILHLLLGGDGLDHQYIHLYSNGDNCPPFLIPFNLTFQSSSFFASVK